MNELEKEYFNDLQKIKETIKQNQNKAMVYVNSQMILTYYQIGTIINQRKTWDSKYIQNLANDLKEYGTNYSSRNLDFMSQLASNISVNEFAKQPVSEIPWGTIINKRKTWGSKYIQNLANDLKEYGKGFSTQNLKYMSRLANEFSCEEFSQQLADKIIQWFTLVEILYKSQSH